MSALLEVQKAARAAMLATPALVALVPAAAILDRNARPNLRPSIVIGEGQEVQGDLNDGGDLDVFLDLHIWVKEPATTLARQIGWQVRMALRAKRALGGGFQLAGWDIQSARFMRDPDGETSHGVITLAARVTGGGL